MCHIVPIAPCIDSVLSCAGAVRGDAVSAPKVGLLSVWADWIPVLLLQAYVVCFYYVLGRA